MGKKRRKNRRRPRSGNRSHRNECTIIFLEELVEGFWGKMSHAFDSDHFEFSFGAVVLSSFCFFVLWGECEKKKKRKKGGE